MSSRRTLILIASIAIGAVAAFALFNYVSGIEDDAYSNAERVDVYVVRQTIPKGYPGEQARAQGDTHAAGEMSQFLLEIPGDS